MLSLKHGDHTLKVNQPLSHGSQMWLRSWRRAVSHSLPARFGQRPEKLSGASTLSGEKTKMASGGLYSIKGRDTDVGFKV